jgi:hypothetical protein
LLTKRYRQSVTARDLFAYIAAIAAHPGYVGRFRSHLVQPGLRIPITASAKRFFRATELGRTVIWLHTFGERLADARQARPGGPPRLPASEAPRIPKDGAIPAGSLPDTIEYDEGRQRLRLGQGYIDRVTPAMWNYEVSGKQVIPQWFSYRRAGRERPIIGDRRPPSKLGDIQPDHWLPEYTTELLSVLNVLGLLTKLEPEQDKLLKEICAGPTITAQEIEAAKEAAQAPPTPTPPRRTRPQASPDQMSFFD